jgi:uncharacterized protein (DUF488 family)
MKIYTSYFAKIKELQAAGIVTVSIARHNLRWASADYQMKELAPSTPKMESETEYRILFEEILNQLDTNRILSKLKVICQEEGKSEIALICYERPADFCHRQLVADWLNNDIDTLWAFCDEKVTEWKPKEKGLFK